ncbi:MAG: mRNA surveillance protein pelota [Candidatus Aenigmarchaeota archaeon]
MRILKKDMRHGVISLRPETLDDLWHLEKVLEPGDMVRARTMRKITLKRGEEIVKGERKPVTLTVEAEKIGFHETGRLRITGRIRGGPEDMSGYHTIEVEPGNELTVTKEWKRDQLDRLERAKVKEPLLYICVIDREGADFGGLKASGLEMLGSIRFRKVMGEEKREGFYDDVMKHLSKQDKYERIILAGPGFEGENLFRRIKEKEPKLAKRISLEKASNTGRTGIQEVIKTSADKVLEGTRVSRETKLVEKLLEEIGKDGMAVYGKKETQAAVAAGAVETLLVSETMVRVSEGMMDLAEKTGAKVMIISASHEAGEKFLSLGGVGGILRYRV